MMQETESLVLSMIRAWYLYTIVSICQDVSQFFTLLILSIKLQENFNQPYLSDSFSDFWSRRWNLVMRIQLKELCYEPIIQGSLSWNERISLTCSRSMDCTEKLLREKRGVYQSTSHRNIPYVFGQWNDSCIHLDDRFPWSRCLLGSRHDLSNQSVCSCVRELS